MISKKTTISCNIVFLLLSFFVKSETAQSHNKIKILCPRDTIPIEKYQGSRYCCKASSVKYSSSNPKSYTKRNYGVTNEDTCERHGPALIHEKIFPLNSDVKLFGYYKDGYREGGFTQYTNGPLRGKVSNFVEYKDGRKNGLIKGAGGWEGIPMVVGQFVDNEPVGNWFLYSPAGDLEHLLSLEESVKIKSCTSKECKANKAKSYFTGFDESSYSYSGKFAEDQGWPMGQISIGYLGRDPSLTLVYPRPKFSNEILGFFSRSLSFFKKLPEKCSYKPFVYEGANEVVMMGVKKVKNGFCHVAINSECNLYGWVKCQDGDQEGFPIVSYRDQIKRGSLIFDKWDEVYYTPNGVKIDIKKIIGEKIDSFDLNLEEFSGEGLDAWGKFKLKESKMNDSGKPKDHKPFWIKIYNGERKRTIGINVRGC